MKTWAGPGLSGLRDWVGLEIVHIEQCVWFVQLVRKKGYRFGEKELVLGKRERKKKVWKWRQAERCRFGEQRVWPTSHTLTYAPVWSEIASRNPTRPKPSLVRRSISLSPNGSMASLKNPVRSSSLFNFHHQFRLIYQ